MSAEPTQKIAIIGLIIGCLIFGGGGIIVALVPIGSYAIAFWRLLIGGIVFALLAFFTQQPLPTSPKARWFTVFSGAALGIDLALWHESIHAVGVGISTLLNSLQIFFLALIGYVWFAEKQSKIQLLSLLLAVAGVAMIGSPEFGHNHHALWGFISGITSGAMLAGSMSFIRLAHQAEQQTHGQEVAIFPLMGLIGAGGAIALALPMLWLDTGKILPTTWQAIGGVVVYGTIVQCVAWGLIAYSIPRLSLALTGLILLSEPVVALLIDYFYLHKSIIMVQWLGACLTMFAIYLGSLKAKS
mgnify:CR=1 FL=1